MGRYLFRLMLGFCCILQTLIAKESSLRSVYLGSRESDPASLVGNVSTIYGDYTEIEVDLVVSAPDSLILFRSYSSRDTMQIANFGGWRFNPHCFLKVQKGPEKKTITNDEGSFESIYAYIGNPEGTILTYIGWQNASNRSTTVLFKIDTEGEAIGLANTSKGTISSWTNLKNNALIYSPQTDSFELHLCNLGKRIYGKHPFVDCYVLTVETLPSGNKIFYEYDNKGQLAFIKETNNSEKKILAWIKISYGKEIHVEASDGKTIDYQFDQQSGLRLLTEVNRSNKPSITYKYQVRDQYALLEQKILPEGRYVQIEYYSEGSSKNKVRSVLIPLADDQASVIKYNYDKRFTQVDGPGIQKSIYEYNDKHELITIEQYLDGSPYRIHRKEWGTGADACNLVSTRVEDAQGQVFHYKQFVYGERGDVIEQREYGDIIGSEGISQGTGHQNGRVKRCSYFSGTSTHGFIHKDETGAGVKYWYKKGTNLLLKKLILTQGSDDKEYESVDSIIKERHFYTYNDDAVLVRVIVDDGSRDQLKENVDEDFTERHVTIIFPKQELPNVGAPEIIEQRNRSLEKKSEPLLNRTINEFDDQGNIISQTVYDADEKPAFKVSKEYQNGLLTLERDPIGNEAHYSYDANHNLISSFNSGSGVTFEYGYDLQNRLISTTQVIPSGQRFSTRTHYDQAGYKIVDVDRYGNETTYVNDGLGRPIQITFASHKAPATYHYTYDLFDNPILIEDPKGRLITKTYNIQGLPTEIHYPDRTKELFNYDGGGHLRKHLRRDGIVQDYQYNDRGKLTKLEYFERGGENKVFKKMTYAHNAFHKTLETDENNVETTYSYDEAGRIASTKKANQKVDFIYDSLGRTKAIKKWKSSSSFTLEVKEHDILGRVIEDRIENSMGHVLTKHRYHYNNAGLLDKIIGYPQNEESTLLQYEYDHFGRLLKITNATNHSTTITYDDEYINEWGQRTQKRIITDPLGNLTEEVLDTDGHIIKTTQKSKSGEVLSEREYEFDSLGNLTHETASLISHGSVSGQYKTERSFDVADCLKTLTYGDTTKIHYEYNPYGDLTATHLPGKEPIHTNYNTKGELELVSYLDNREQKYYKLRYTQGRVVQYCDSFNTIINDYDGNDLLIAEEILDSYGEYLVGCSYDGEGKIEKLILPDASYVEYTYDGPFVKGLKRFNKDKKELYSYSITARDLMGNILSEILPGKVGERKQSWDKAGRKIAIKTDYFQDLVLNGGYDAIGNLTHQETCLKEDRYATEYAYDPLSRLISEIGSREYLYTYDSLENLLSKNSCSYEVNALNQLTKAEDISYKYDQCGNLVAKIKGQNEWKYESNSLNQITSITFPDQSRAIFTYDLNGKRLSKHRLVDKEKSDVQRFFYLGNTEIGSLDEKGNIIDLKIPCDPNDPEGPSAAIELKKTIYIPIDDLQGNIACLIDLKDRTVAENYRYTAFGEETIYNNRGGETTDSTIGNPYRYRGKRMDKEECLIYFGYRYYSPDVGRWITPDPLGTIDGPNLYAYTHNNPFHFRDHFGLSSEDSEHPSCVCGHCVRKEFCHCLQGIDHHDCVCKGIFCIHKADRSIVNDGRNLVGILRDTGYGVVNFALTNTRFQGAMQAFGGLSKVTGGGLVLYGSGGTGIAVSLPIMVHGVDQFITGMRTVFTGVPGISATEHLLQTAGMSSDAASFTNSMINFVDPRWAIKGASFLAGKAGRLQKGFKPFNGNNYRHNIKVLTGMNPPSNIEAHHVFPQIYRTELMKKGINIDDPKYLTWWESPAHGRYAGNYNAKWREFFRRNPDATEVQILETGKEIMADYGLITNY